VFHEKCLGVERFRKEVEAFRIEEEISIKRERYCTLHPVPKLRDVSGSNVFEDAETSSA
jgi:hypothetical protein